MNNALFGLGLMIALMIGQGMMFGYELEEKNKEPRELRFSPVTLFPSYVGSLMLAPEAIRANPTYLGYAAVTVCVGLALVAASTFLTMRALRIGNRLMLGPGPVKPETKPLGK